MAVGDLDGDGSDDVIVGASASSIGRRQRVHAFLTSTPPTSIACDETSWSRRLLSTVPTGLTAIHAAQASIRGSVAVWPQATSTATVATRSSWGVPNAVVDEQADAGAVWVLRASGPQGGPLTLATATVLRDSVAAMGTRPHGAVVAVALIGARRELLASAASQDQVRMFLCTGLTGDSPNNGGLGPDCR